MTAELKDVTLREFMRTLGIIGGTSWHSTIEYYRYINSAVNALHGDETNPPLVLYNLNQREIHQLQLADRWDEIATIYTGATLRLRSIGADAVLFAANTAHRVFSEVSLRTQTPILHIGDAIGLAVQSTGVTTVGLIGTVYTMEHGFLRNWLEEHYGVQTLVPLSSTVRNELQRIIQKELGMGDFRAETKKYVMDQIRELRRRGARGIVLGCTEFPLIIGQADLDVPVFDTTRLHAQMAVHYVVGHYTPAQN